MLSDRDDCDDCDDRNDCEHSVDCHDSDGDHDDDRDDCDDCDNCDDHDLDRHAVAYNHVTQSHITLTLTLSSSTHPALRTLFHYSHYY